jgi:glucose uptake protein GlcU
MPINSQRLIYMSTLKNIIIFYEKKKKKKIDYYIAVIYIHTL